MHDIARRVLRRLRNIRPGRARRLAEEIATYRHAFETTAIDRDRLAVEAATYRHAFETTCADRDRAAADAATFRHAFETTAADRDLAVARHAALRRSVSSLLVSGAPPAAGRHRAPGLGPPVSRTSAAGVGGRAQPVPNVYCVGTPKSGTSFLYSMIRQHPLVDVVPKDSSLLPEMLIGRQQCDFDAYYGASRAAGSDKPVLCEFQVDFAILPGGARFIRDVLAPDSAIVFCLRDPLERALSEYRMRVRTLREPDAHFAEWLDFREALEQSAARREAEDPLEYLPFHAYLDKSMYVDLIRPYWDAFGRENVLVEIFEEELKGECAYKGILRFFEFVGILDCDAMEVAFTDGSAYAQMSKAPSEISVSFLCDDGRVLTDELSVETLLAASVREIAVRSNVEQQLSRRICSPSRRVIAEAATLRRRHDFRLDPEQARELYKLYFEDSVERLEEALGRDLSCWSAKYR